MPTDDHVVQKPEPSNQPLHIGITVVLTRRCNLACTYCNIEAGPTHSDPGLDPEDFERWMERFADLGDISFYVQLHGGEPLIVYPPIETYAAIAANVFESRPRARLQGVGMVTNATKITPRRAKSLAAAGITNYAVSLDGPPEVHDRSRIHANGRGSHSDVMAGVRNLRYQQIDFACLSVVPTAADVMPILDWYLQEGFDQVRLNPMQPQGRARETAARDEESMIAFADAYLAAAKKIAAINRDPGQVGRTRGFRENNLFVLAEDVLRTSRGEPEADRGLGDTQMQVMLDDTNHLWWTPFGEGEKMLVCHGAPDTAEAFHRCFGLHEVTRDPTGAPVGRMAQLMRKRASIMSACPGCPRPWFCAGFTDLNEGNAGPDGKNPICVWRERLLERLRDWHMKDPTSFAYLLHVGAEDEREVGEERRDGAGATPSEEGAATREVELRASHPVAAEIVGALRSTEQGADYIDGYARWVKRLAAMSADSHGALFVELAKLAQQCARADRTSWARALAGLARLGLLRAAKEIKGVKPRRSERSLPVI
jgi:molybdenum cofactor biosynthesis enzyme MoaA